MAYDSTGVFATCPPPDPDSYAPPRPATGRLHMWLTIEDGPVLWCAPDVETAQQLHDAVLGNHSTPGYDTKPPRGPRLSELPETAGDPSVWYGLLIEPLTVDHLRMQGQYGLGTVSWYERCQDGWMEYKSLV